MRTKILIKEDNDSFLNNFKYFLKRLFNRSIYDHRISTNLNLETKSKNIIKKVNFNFLKNRELLLATANGLYIIKKNELVCVFKDNGFYGVAKYKNKYFVACKGRPRHHTQGAIISFNYISGKVKNIKIEYKLREQAFHDIKIFKKKLYVVNSTWRKNKIGKILKFNIENENFKLEKTITVDTNYPFSHLNTIFFKKNSILVCYHNYTKITRIPSQICELSKEWKFKKIVETSNLSCAHDCSIINKKLHVLDSEHGIFYMGKDKIHFKNRFLKGLDYDGQKYYVGVNRLAQRYNRKSMSPDLVLIDRKKKKKRFIKLYKIGNINNITVLK